jgi:hypothetical protein
MNYLRNKIIFTNMALRNNFMVSNIDLTNYCRMGVATATAPHYLCSRLERGGRSQAFHLTWDRERALKEEYPILQVQPLGSVVTGWWALTAQPGLNTERILRAVR